ncbi:MAG: hypothetical protein GXP31_07445 [Kiritimatiellaeota bacterium]|nr:hypothetical protein [Kiritimatiellota bacterium]
MKTIRMACAAGLIGLGILALGTLGTAWVRAAEHEGAPGALQGGGDKAGALVETVQEKSAEHAAIFYAIAISVGASCLAAGYAVGKVGAAALGAAAEHPELMGRALIFVGLAEGIAIYGLIIAVMLIRKL